MSSLLPTVLTPGGMWVSRLLRSTQDKTFGFREEGQVLTQDWADLRPTTLAAGVSEKQLPRTVRFVL